MASRQDLLATYISRLKYSPEKIQPHLSDLIPSRLVDSVRTNFYNPIVLEMATCVLFSIFVSTTSGIPMIERVRYWFRDLEQIGTESVEGYAMRTDLGSLEDTFILKAPRDPNNADLLHELLVGLYGTNRLRTMLPNFAYLFGGFNCSGPIIQPRAEIIGGRVARRDTVEVVSYCDQTSTTVPYIIYENIAPGSDLETYTRTCSIQEFLNSYVQLTLALRTAFNQIGFVHNDPHTGNAIIRQMGQQYSIPYSTQDGLRFITTDRIATLIDFGRSRFVYRGSNYGYSGLEFVGVFPDLPLPYLDVYKLFFFSLYSMVEAKNWTTFNQAKQLVPFFHPEISMMDPNVDQRIFQLLLNGRQEVFYPFTLTPKDQVAFRRLHQTYSQDGRLDETSPSQWKQAIRFSYDNLMTFLTSTFDCPFITSKPVTKLAWCGPSCGSSAQILNSFFDRPLNQTPVPEDFFELYDLYTSKQGSDKLKTRLISQFGSLYSRARDDYMMDLVARLNQIRDEVNSIRPDTSLVGRNITTIILLAGEYRERFTRIATASSLLKHLPFTIGIGKDIASLYKDTTLSRDVDAILDQEKAYHQQLQTYISNLVLDRDYLVSILRNKPKILRNNQDPNVIWLQGSFSSSLQTLLQ